MTSVDEDERQDPDTGDYDEQRFAKPLAEMRNVCEARDVLMNDIAHFYFNQKLDVADVHAFSADAEKSLKWARGDRAIEATVQHHVGRTLAEQDWRKICWQLAANEFYLTRGIPLQPDLSLYGDRWMIVDIIGVNTEPYTDAYARLEFRALTGMAAGWSMEQDMSEGQLYYLAGQFGYRGRKHQPWYTFEGDPMHLFGLYFVALIEDLQINRYACTGQLYDVNRKIMRMRYRAPGEEEDGEVLDQWGNSVDLSKRQQGCPARHKHACWNCPQHRHVVLKTGRVAPAGTSCAAGY